ncbi:MAG: type II toxin-antitoxin system RelE/ParE family toxin [Nostoc sp. DedQUE12a]|nr:type II toxin-antitoxin system RelE/ParE family toxin [Nostoc sp. DedQUE12a]
MAIEVEYTDEFEQWYLTLDEAEQDSIDFVVELLEEKGVNLGFPYSTDIKTSRHKNMRELRVQHQGESYRILYCFDPRRIAVLLLGGNKTGDDRRWYDKNVPKADKLYDELLKELEDEGFI